MTRLIPSTELMDQATFRKLIGTEPAKRHDDTRVVATASISNPITIDLPLPPDCLHPNARPNRWGKAKAVKSSRELARSVASRQRPATPLKHACYRLVFRLPRKRDYDGLGAWVKAYIDGLVDAGILIDDSEFRPMGIERFSGRKETGGEFGVRFVIWPETMP